MCTGFAYSFHISTTVIRKCKQTKISFNDLVIKVFLEIAWHDLNQVKGNFAQVQYINITLNLHMYI